VIEGFSLQGDGMARCYFREPAAKNCSDKYLTLAWHHTGTFATALVWLIQGFVNQGLELPKIHWIDG